MTINKIILVMCFTLCLSNIVFAGEPLALAGYVDEKRLFYNHPKWGEIEEKREAVQQAYKKKAETSKENASDENTIDVDFYVRLAQDQEKELNKIMISITKEIHTAVENVRIKKISVL